MRLYNLIEDHDQKFVTWESQKALFLEKPKYLLMLAGQNFSM